jgi:hypothetical protein
MKIKTSIKKKKGPITYEANHIPAMEVPKGGSSCLKCKFWDGEDCENEHYRKWNNGSGKIPTDPDSYCSDWFTPK